MDTIIPTTTIKVIELAKEAKMLSKYSYGTEILITLSSPLEESRMAK